jgi:hypothetical protein
MAAGFLRFALAAGCAMATDTDSDATIPSTNRVRNIFMVVTSSA